MLRKTTHGNTKRVRKGWYHIEMERVMMCDFVENNAKRMPLKSRMSIDGMRHTTNYSKHVQIRRYSSSNQYGIANIGIQGNIY